MEESEGAGEREKHVAAKGSAEGGKERGGREGAREREKHVAAKGSAEGGKERG